MTESQPAVTVEITPLAKPAKGARSSDYIVSVTKPDKIILCKVLDRAFETALDEKEIVLADSIKRLINKFQVEKIKIEVQPKQNCQQLTLFYHEIN